MYDNYLVYSISSVIYKIDVVSDSVKPVKISETKIDEIKDDSRLIPEIVGDYLYALCHKGLEKRLGKKINKI